jgi:1-deoxy-D-xylulose-5-phosphate synthase
MDDILSRIESPQDLRSLSMDDLKQLAREMRDELCRVVSLRTAHFASNLGVVELAIALHRVFDFSRDRLIWDTGHQIYPHKLLTGRHRQIHTIRTKGGLMGYPNPAESDYDLFMTGHAGCSVSCAVGLKTGDDLLGRTDRRTVAVIGDGALPSGVVFEALNNGGGLKKDLLVILNDNKMSICPRVGALARYLDRARMTPFYSGLKEEIHRVLSRVPLVGDQMERAFIQWKEGVKASLHGGMLFEELGWRYIGPVDGHDLEMLTKYLDELKNAEGPILLHVFTEKGHGFQPACEDPVRFHTPAPFERNGDDLIPLAKGSSRAYTDVASDAIFDKLKDNSSAAVITAAMCEGNKLQKLRSELPHQFFDVGICESHAVAFAAGLAKTGVRPIVAIYSTFLQRAYDQLFQEVALQNLPVAFCLDRAGLTGPDGPTHHGAFDTVYMRAFPNFVLMAPGDELDVPLMLDFALRYDGPAALRYPKAKAERIDRSVAPVELGQAEVLDWGDDGIIIAYGSLLGSCVRAASRLRGEGMDVGVINARFAKPLDTATVLRAIEHCGFVITVEEGTLQGGFGSAVLEAANDAGLATTNVRRLGLPDQFVPHAERDELLADIGLNEDGIYRHARELAAATGVGKPLAHAQDRRVG